MKEQQRVADDHQSKQQLGTSGGGGGLVMKVAVPMVNNGGCSTTTAKNRKSSSMISTSSRKIMKKKKYGGLAVAKNRGAWSAEEDKKLTDYVMIHGDKKWRSLPTEAGLNRCGKSCRLRWLNYLRPGIKRGNITEDEEDLIIRLHNLLGNRWSLIAGRLPGRTDNEIKNHWNTHLSKKSLTINELNLKLNRQNLDPKIDTQPPSTFLNTNLSSSMNWDTSDETGMLNGLLDEDFDMNGLFSFSVEPDFPQANQLGGSSELLGNETYDKFSDPELNIQGSSSGSLDGQFPCSILDFEKLLYSEMGDDMFLNNYD